MNEADVVRPKQLSNYVGQEQIKSQLKVAIQSALKRRDALPHIVMAGPPGLGKTTIAEILANEMGSKFHSVMASSIENEKVLSEILGRLSQDGYNELNGDVEDRSKIHPEVIFIDEIHRLKKPITELLHTALEDFTITLKNKTGNGGSRADKYWIPRFTLIGATNYLGQLPKPFVDRFLIQLMFEIYSPAEIAKVVSFSANKLGLKIEDYAIEEISTKSRGVPRIANRFLLKSRDVMVVADKEAIDAKCVSDMFSIQGIDDLGLTKLDRKVLAYLAKIERPVGVVSVAQGVDEDASTIENLVEPWLTNLQLMVKTGSGRMITEKGLAHISGEDNQKQGLKKIRKPQ